MPLFKGKSEHKGDSHPPDVLDIEFTCPECKRKVRARLTAYWDVIYITCLPKKHHFSYDRSEMIPGYGLHHKAGRDAGKEDTTT